jgi:hypothetical protein
MILEHFKRKGFQFPLYKIGIALKKELEKI